MNKTLNINPAYANLIPPLSAEEFQGLEESILAYGQCRDAIKAWKGTIIDGHNRYAICQKHNIPYNVEAMCFASKKEAELWIVQNQLGRRNLPTILRVKLVLRKQALLREEGRKNRKGCHGKPVNTRKIMANEIGVSEGTLHKYMTIYERGGSNLIAKLEAGEVKLNVAYREASTATAAANEPALEVVTRTVEAFVRDGAGTLDFNNPYCRRGVLGNSERLVKLFGFACGHVALVADLCDVSRVGRKVNTQLRVLGRL